MDKRFFIILIVIMVGFFSLFIISKDKTDDSTTAATSGSSHYYGKEDSPVTITEFVDFQCEACYAYYPYVKQVKEQYKDQVRFQVRHFPISSGHQFAMQAARTAEAAGKQGKFWEMHDKIFEGQKTWERSQDPTSIFDGYAQEIGLDMTQFKSDFASEEVNATINKDLQDVKELGGTGTPTFAINGKKIENPGATVEELSKMIEDALKAEGITPNPAPAQPATNSQTAPPTGTSGLAPGESQEDHDRESQQSQ